MSAPAIGASQPVDEPLKRPDQLKRPVSPPSADMLDPEERMSRDELEALQLRRLQHVLRYAYERVPTYRRKFDEAGVRPEDLRELADLRHFPYTTKDDLREAYPFGMFAVPREQVLRIHASSGTTGRATVVGYTRQDIDNWGSLVARSLRAAGVRPGDIVHNAYGYGLFTGGVGLHYGAERLGCTVVPISGGQTERQVQLINDFRPDVIVCTPTYLLTILDGMVEAGIEPGETSLRIGVLGAEPWTDQMRAEIEGRLGIKALDIYGLSEVMGPGVASECVETVDGPTIWEDHFLPEIVDPLDPSRVLADGDEGELVFTSLTKEAMPVIRYRTRDLTRLLPGTARPAMRRIGRITGRSDDMVILRGVNLFPTQIEEIALRIPTLSPHFQLEITRPHRLDEMTIRIEARDGTTSEERDRAAKTLAHDVKSNIGASAKVEVVDPGTLPRSMGKLRRIYDFRNR